MANQGGVQGPEPLYHYQKIENTFPEKVPPTNVQETILYKLNETKEAYAKHILRAGIVLTIIPLAILCLAKKMDTEMVKKAWHGEVKRTLPAKEGDPARIQSLFDKFLEKEYSLAKGTELTGLIDTTNLNPRYINESLMRLRNDKDQLMKFVNMLSPEQMENFPASAIPYLDVTKLTEDERLGNGQIKVGQISVLFGLHDPITHEDEDSLARLALLTGEQLNSLLPKFKPAQITAALRFVYQDLTSEKLKKASIEFQQYKEALREEGPDTSYKIDREKLSHSVQHDLERLQALDLSKLSDLQAQGYVDMLKNTDTDNERVRLFAALTPKQFSDLRGKVTLEDIVANPQEVHDFALDNDPSFYLQGGDVPQLSEDKIPQLITKLNSYNAAVNTPAQKQFVNSFRKLNEAQTTCFTDFIRDSDQIEEGKRPALNAMIVNSQKLDTPQHFLSGYPVVVKPDEKERLIALLNTYDPDGPQSVPMQRFSNALPNLTEDQLIGLHGFVKESPDLSRALKTILTDKLMEALATSGGYVLGNSATLLEDQGNVKRIREGAKTYLTYVCDQYDINKDDNGQVPKFKSFIGGIKKLSTIEKDCLKSFISSSQLDPVKKLTISNNMDELHAHPSAFLATYLDDDNLETLDVSQKREPELAELLSTYQANQANQDSGIRLFLRDLPQLNVEELYVLLEYVRNVGVLDEVKQIGLEGRLLAVLLMKVRRPETFFITTEDRRVRVKENLKDLLTEILNNPGSALNTQFMNNVGKLSFIQKLRLKDFINANTSKVNEDEREALCDRIDRAVVNEPVAIVPPNQQVQPQVQPVVEQQVPVVEQPVVINPEDELPSLDLPEDANQGVVPDPLAPNSVIPQAQGGGQTEIPIQQEPIPNVVPDIKPQVEVKPIDIHEDVEIEISAEKPIVTTPEVTEKGRLVPNKGTNVGTLGAKWTFDSDHLPIGCSLQLGDGETKSTINVASINICNTKKVEKAVIKNDVYKVSGAQGLDGSNMTIHHNKGKKVEGGLTQRELNTVEYIVDMLIPKNLGTLPRDVVCVQECSQEVRLVLEKKLKDKGFIFVKANISNPKQVSQLYIYNSKKLSLAKVIVDETFKHPTKKTVIMHFVDNKKNAFSLVGTHLPLENNKEKIEQLGGVLKDLVLDNQDDTVLLMGDMSAGTNDVSKGIAKAFEGGSIFEPVTNGTPTYINVKKESVDNDSIHIFKGKNSSCVENKPEEILPGLDSVAVLLTKSDEKTQPPLQKQESIPKQNIPKQEPVQETKPIAKAPLDPKESLQKLDQEFWKVYNKESVSVILADMPSNEKLSLVNEMIRDVKTVKPSKEVAQTFAKSVIQMKQPSSLKVETPQSKWRNEMIKERDSLLTRFTTAGDGSCGLHALFDERQMIDGILTYKCDAKTKRAKFCKWLQERFEADNLPETIKGHLLSFLVNPGLLQSFKYTSLNTAIGKYYIKHRPDPKVFVSDEMENNFIQDKEMFKAYLGYLSRTGVDLYQEELEAAAMCFGKTIELFEPGMYPSTTKVSSRKLNDQEGLPVVTMWYNGSTHYEKAVRIQPKKDVITEEQVVQTDKKESPKVTVQPQKPEVKLETKPVVEEKEVKEEVKIEKQVKTEAPVTTSQKKLVNLPPKWKYIPKDKRK